MLQREPSSTRQCLPNFRPRTPSSSASVPPSGARYARRSKLRRSAGGDIPSAAAAIVTDIQLPVPEGDRSVIARSSRKSAYGSVYCAVAQRFRWEASLVVRGLLVRRPSSSQQSELFARAGLDFSFFDRALFVAGEVRPRDEASVARIGRR